MDPGRQAMIEGWKSPNRRDIAAPRRDPNTRVSKPARRPATKPAASTNKSSYVTQDEQERKFVAEEDEFVLKQAKKKSDIRVREGRAKAIDNLAFSLRFIDPDRDVFDDDDGDVEIDVLSPEAVIGKLDEVELKELESGIKSYTTLERNEANRGYWKSLLTLCDDRRQKLRPQGPEGRTLSSVASDVDKQLSPKTFEQLEALEKRIRAKLQSDEPIDTDYWEQLLKSLLVWKAKARLNKIYESIKQSRMDLLAKIDPEKARALQLSQPIQKAASTAAQQTKSVSKPAAQSPSTGAQESAPPGTERFAQLGSEDFSQATKALYEREIARGIGEDEEIFAAEEAVPASTKPQWADKYRPRKPRYFNRVQMGYEWNKYNQTHYDHDNPPPKVVQGYKFNIFYPDLIDKTKAPTFKIIREGGRRRGESFAPAGEEDTCLLRFVAGPPYEDIAFRIVDREWDYSAKRERGFKSTFDKGILQLHFQFKRIFYRK